MSALPEPSNDTEPETSPLKEIVRAVANLVAVLALPVNAPTKDVEVTEERPVKVVTVAPSATLVLPMVTELLVSELLPIFERVLLAPEIVLLVRVCVPSNVTTVESISNVTLVAAPTAATVEVRPVPPTKVIVSVPRATESVPVSPAIERVVEIFAVPAAVRRPCASTVNVGIAVAEP